MYTSKDYPVDSIEYRFLKRLEDEVCDIYEVPWYFKEYGIKINNGIVQCQAFKMHLEMWHRYSMFEVLNAIYHDKEHACYILDLIEQNIDE